MEQMAHDMDKMCQKKPVKYFLCHRIRALSPILQILVKEQVESSFHLNFDCPSNPEEWLPRLFSCLASDGSSINTDSYSHPPPLTQLEFSRKPFLPFYHCGIDWDKCAGNFLQLSKKHVSLPFLFDPQTSYEHCFGLTNWCLKTAPRDIIVSFFILGSFLASFLGLSDLSVTNPFYITWRCWKVSLNWCYKHHCVTEAWAYNPPLPPFPIFLYHELMQQRHNSEHEKKH